MIPTFIEKIIGYIVGKLFQLFYDEEDPYRWWNPLNVRGRNIHPKYIGYIFSFSTDFKKKKKKRNLLHIVNIVNKYI